MITRDVIENMGFCEERDLRYFIYLSRNNEWVKSGDKLYKFVIEELVKDGKSHTVSKQDEPSLKLLIGKTALFVGVLKKFECKEFMDVSSHPKLQDLGLSPVAHRFRMKVRLQDCREKNVREIIHVNALAYDYDAEFAHNFNPLDASGQSQDEFISSYRSKKEVASLNADKNAIWLAAASGDHQQLALLLHDLPGFNLHEKYKEKAIVEAMLAADPKQDVVYGGYQDYKRTIALLVGNGFSFKRGISEDNAKTSLDLCREYPLTQCDSISSRFFQSETIPQKVVAEVAALFSDEIPIKQSKVQACTIL